MMLRRPPPALYAAFDRFPSAKGAATHIDQFARTLFDTTGGGVLWVLGDEGLPLYQHEGQVEIVRHAGEQTNYLERALGFGRRLAAFLEAHAASLRICHFRDPWSGVPIVARRDRAYATVYEVNGLPSIELPSYYPHLSPATLSKIRAAEAFCWTQADAIVTPSETIAANLVRLGAAREKIAVVPNGATVPVATPPRPAGAPARYLLYFGALQPWQGVDMLLRAFARLADLPELHLVVCSASHPRSAKPYRRLADRLEVTPRVVWHHALGRDVLAGWIAHAALSAAPLAECARNLEQGCAPLKILESMAHGVPVVASDLPAVREMIREGRDGKLVRPDRPAELARAIRVLLEYPGRLRAMGEAARRAVARHYTWARSTAALAAVYRALLGARRAASRRATGAAITGLAR